MQLQLQNAAKPLNTTLLLPHRCNADSEAEAETLRGTRNEGRACSQPKLSQSTVNPPQHGCTQYIYFVLVRAEPTDAGQGRLFLFSMNRCSHFYHSHSPRRRLGAELLLWRFSFLSPLGPFPSFPIPPPVCFDRLPVTASRNPFILKLRSLMGGSGTRVHVLCTSYFGRAFLCFPFWATVGWAS